MNAEADNLEARHQAALYWIAVAHQQNFYEISSDWNRYEKDESVYLKNYIGYSLYGPPSIDELNTEIIDNENSACKEYIYCEKNAQFTINAIYNKIVEHGTQINTENEILCSIVYVCLYNEDLVSQCDLANLENLIVVKPIFKINKNMEHSNDEVWYIDDVPRVYKGWKDFLGNNNLPDWTMVVPKDGIYQADLKEIWSEFSSSVWVEVIKNKPSTNVIKHLDVASTIVNVGCIGIGVCSMFTPLAPAVIAASACGAVTTGVWGWGRSAQDLIDRKNHDQSINVTNKEAISSWLGVIGGTIGLGAGGTSALLGRAIRSGTKIAEGAKVAHDAIIISNAVVNGIGIGFQSVNIYNQYQEDGTLSKKDILFLSAHILFVCNSVVNIKLANDIIKTNQKQILNDYEASLRSNRHRKEFRRLVRNTGKLFSDEVSRNEQIIRSITKINNKDEFFAFMVRQEKSFKKSGKQASFADGHVHINGEKLILPSEFYLSCNQALSSSASISESIFGSSVVSRGAIKGFLSVLVDFYSRNDVSISDDARGESSNFHLLFKRLAEYFRERANEILVAILEVSLSIAQASNFNIEDILARAANFVWRVIERNIALNYPVAYNIANRFRNEIRNTVNMTINYIRSNIRDWIAVFKKYIREDIEYDYLHAHLDLIDLNTFTAQSDENIKQQIHHILLSDTLNNDSHNRMSVRQMTKIGMEELLHFFSKHGIKATIPLSQQIEKYKSILTSLEEINTRWILFYKLLVIATNISKQIRGREATVEHILPKVTKFVWIVMKLNYKNETDAIILSSQHEDTIMNIVVALYNYERTKPIDWIQAYNRYETLQIT